MFKNLKNICLVVFVSLKKQSTNYYNIVKYKNIKNCYYNLDI